jgi:hypothetical protein
MNVEIGTEAPIFLFWEYLFQIFGILSLQCVCRQIIVLPFKPCLLGRWIIPESECGDESLRSVLIIKGGVSGTKQYKFYGNKITGRKRQRQFFLKKFFCILLFEDTFYIIIQR